MNNKTLCPSLLLCLSLLAPLSCLGETAAAPYPLAHPPRLADYLPPPPAAALPDIPLLHPSSPLGYVPQHGSVRPLS